MEQEKICPIMAQGWLSNKYSSRGSSTFSLENLPKCIKEKCAFWNKFCGACGGRNT
jgi:hypothetical protein